MPCMTLIRLTGVVMLSAAVALAAVAVAARWSDGPIGPFCGGPFRSGQPFAGIEVDWQALARNPQVELQLVNPPRSRTTHFVVLDNQAYVPSGIVKVGPFVFVGGSRSATRPPLASLASGLAATQSIRPSEKSTRSRSIP